MEPQLKKRLVGGIVLVALAVIFIPMLLDGSGSRPDLSLDAEPPPLPPPPRPLPGPEEGPIDLRPAPDTPEPRAAVVDALNAEQIAEEVEASRAQAPESPEAPEAEPSEPPPESAPAPAPPPDLQSWVVQVAALREQDKALAERDRLRGKGLGPVFVERYDSERGQFYRVRFGPLLEREAAEALQARIERELGIEGRVMPHR